MHACPCIALGGNCCCRGCCCSTQSMLATLVMVGLIAVLFAVRHRRYLRAVWRRLLGGRLAA